MNRSAWVVLLFIAMGVSSVAQTLAINTSNKLYGYRNSDGGWEIAPQYQYAYPFEGHFKRFAVVKQDRFWGCIDVRGQMVVRNIFLTKEEAEVAGKEWEKGEEPGKWVYPAQNPASEKWGFVDYYGNWKFQPVYDGASRFEGKDPMSFAAVKINERWGCIDGKGVMVVAPVFMRREHATNAGYQWINGRHYDTWLYPTQDKSTKLWGYVNYLGRWTIPAEYEDYDYFGSDNNYVYAQVKKGGRWGTIDRHGNVISHCIFFTREDADYALLQLEHQRPQTDWRLPVSDPETNKWGWVDYTGEWVIEPIYQAATHFTNDTGLFATAKLEGLWASIGSDGTLLSRNVFILSSEAWKAGYEWDNEQELGHWLYPIQNPETKYWGYVNFKGDWVIPPHFEDAKLFIYTWNNRAAPAQMDGKWGCIDHTGQFVVKNIYESSSEAQTAGLRWAQKTKF
ncbi:MAG: WG repeat-containing protein [Bacteroidales bacterium]|nr:WG repeat-containing protein [Bacteroidales bacterium]